VNASGYVCLGSTRVPQQLTVDSLPLWEKAFFKSEFTHPNAANRLTLRPGGFVGLWKSLVRKKRFPAEHLAEAKETLSQFINRSRGV
jgi:PRTRC genetic system protein B